MVEFLTTKGQELLARSMAGECTITFTKMELGDGELSSGQNVRKMNGLIERVTTLDIQSVDISSDSVVSIKSVFTNDGMSSGFYLREKGLYATDGENEILFSYGNAGADAEWIDVSTIEFVEKEIITICKALQGTTEPVNIELKSGIYAEQTYVDGKFDAIENTINEMKESSSNNDLEFTVENGILCVTYDDGLEESEE